MEDDFLRIMERLKLEQGTYAIEGTFIGGSVGGTVSGPTTGFRSDFTFRPSVLYFLADLIALGAFIDIGSQYTSGTGGGLWRNIRPGPGLRPFHRRSQ